MPTTFAESRRHWCSHKQELYILRTGWTLVYSCRKLRFSVVIFFSSETGYLCVTGLAIIGLAL